MAFQKNEHQEKRLHIKCECDMRIESEKTEKTVTCLLELLELLVLSEHFGSVGIVGFLVVYLPVVQTESSVGDYVML